MVYPAERVVVSVKPYGYGFIVGQAIKPYTI